MPLVPPVIRATFPAETPFPVADLKSVTTLAMRDPALLQRRFQSRCPLLSPQCSLFPLDELISTGVTRAQSKLVAKADVDINGVDTE
jgi:hypothetical protein